MNKYYAKINGVVKEVRKDSKDVPFCMVSVINPVDPVFDTVLMTRIAERINAETLTEGTKVEVLVYDTSVKDEKEPTGYRNYNGNKMIVSVIA